MHIFFVVHVGVDVCVWVVVLILLFSYCCPLHPSPRICRYDFSIQFPRSSNLGVAPNSDNQRIMSKVRRAAIDYNVPLITNLEVAEAFIKSLATVNELNVDSYLDNTDSITKH